MTEIPQRATWSGTIRVREVRHDVEDDWIEIPVTLTIEVARLMRVLGVRAHYASSGRATASNGAIVARVPRRTQP